MTERWVLITGGAKRLGRALCLAFARSQWNVVCHYHGSASEAQETCHEVAQLGSKAVALCADLSDTAALDTLFAQVLAATNGQLDAIVNNASRFEADAGIDFSPALMQSQLAVNLVAPLYLGSLLARSVQGNARQPSIVHVLDQKVFNLNPDYFSYTVSKLALERSVSLQAQALAPQVRVNAIAPGLIYVSGPQDDSNFNQAKSVNLLRSPIDPTDVAKTAVFLAENSALTGVTLCADKGQHLIPLERDIMFVTEQLARSTP